MTLDHTGVQRAPPRNGAARVRPVCSLLDLDDDVFHYVCAFIPLHDLLRGVALVSREAWRRVSANHALWQQLWMRYLYHFCASLIPTTAAMLPRAAGVCAGGDEPSMLHPSPAAAVVDPLHGPHHPLHHSSSSGQRDTSWNLFHFHHSAEVRPHAVQLESLCVLRADITDPCAASTAATAPPSTSSPSTRAEVHAELLRFAQACATQTVARNLTHTTTTTAAAAAAVTASSSTSPAPAPVDAPSPPRRSRGRHPRRLRKQRERHIHRLQRVLHFLLAADGRRPQFHDGLWTATHEAELAHLRRARGIGDTASEADTAPHEHGRPVPTRKRPMPRGGAGRAEPTGPSESAAAQASLHRAPPPPDSPPPPPARLRPMSWLDSDAASVKVLLFDDDTRTVGGAVAVQAERAKLLASLADNWRTAYAAHFYPCPTDGRDPGSAAPHGAPPHAQVERQPSPPQQQQTTTTRSVASLGAGVVGMPSVTLADRTPRTPASPAARAPAPAAAPAPQTGTTFSSGHAAWEQVYRRFRDGQDGPVRRTHTRGNGDGGGGGGGTGVSEEDALNDAAPLPSSSSPLFDLHLLGYTKRKQVYAAMLASTVEVPEGMGAFFATCVSEPFLRWWCWRNRRLTRSGGRPGSPSAPAYAGHHWQPPPPQQQQQQRPPSRPPSPRRSLALRPFRATSGGEAATPTSLWVVRAARLRGDAAQSAHDPVRGPASSAENSVTYSSSYSDVTTTSGSGGFVVGEERVLEDAREDAAGSFSTASAASTSSIVFAEEAGGGGAGGVGGAAGIGAGDDGATATAAPPAQPPLPSYGDPVALLFPLPHMLTYWFMMHHVSFYNYQVYRRTWGDQDLTIAVCSRILSPTGHSAECRLFYSLRCATFPRMFTKMMFTPGVLPSLTLQGKMTERSPYHSGSDRASSSSSSTSSTSNVSRDDDGTGGSVDSASASTNGKPVDSRLIYDLFWTGFGRVEVECGPTISRSNLVRLRIALGLPADFPMGLLWNVVMFASGLGPRILKEHRHSLHFNYAKTFTDVVAEEFGELECYGLGAQPPHKRNDAAAMANPLDAEAADMRERHAMEAVARAVTQGLAELGGTRGGGGDAAGGGGGNDSPAWSGDSPLSATSYGSWNIDSEFSSAEVSYTSGHISDGTYSAYL